MSKTEILMAVDRIINDAKNRGIIHLNADKVNGSKLEVQGRELINFGSCSYLGLEFDKRLIQGSQQAVEKYGTQFSASRAYISCGLYPELEGIFTQIFNSPVMVAPTTTLGHIATVPVIIGPKDAVIVDHQVHSSVQGAVELVKVKGTHVELIRHNRMDMLEERLELLSKDFEKVWYMADGIYSMFGDKAPLKDIERLLNTYENFHFYVDDAHGMSCYGERGQGYVLSKMKMHPRMVVAMSLAKAFATGGAVFVFPNQELADLVRNCGGPMITSGPMQPGALGAAVASGKIHLSEEYAALRDDLHEKIAFTNEQILSHGLPLIAENDSPVFFVGCGLPKVGYNLVKRMNTNGYMTNLGIFPAVPMKNTGLRFTITRLNDKEEIAEMVKNLAKQHALALSQEGSSLKNVEMAFKMKEKKRKTEIEHFMDSFQSSVNLDLSHVNSIKNINADEWDSIHANKGCYDHGSLALLEEVYTDENNPENHWDWDYITIRDQKGRVVISSFLTTTLYKDDMLAASYVSDQIEEMRKKSGPYYMTTRTLSLGSPLTSGEHFFLDNDHPYKVDAIKLFLERVQVIQEKRGADNILLRDFHAKNDLMDEMLLEGGYLNSSLPFAHKLSVKGVSSFDDYLSVRSTKSRIHIRSEILNQEDLFQIQLRAAVSDERIAEYYDLYSKLKKGKKEINTFDLPRNLFHSISKDESWDKIEVLDKASEKLVAVVFNRKSQDIYNMMFIALDPESEGMSVYRQAMLATVKRGIELGCETIDMGFTADIEKHHLGCDAIPTHAYLQAKEHFSMQVIESMHKVNAA